MPFQSTTVLLNPAAGSVGDREVIVGAIKDQLPGVQIVSGREAGALTQLTRKALADGARTVIAAGGDGTLNEVLNGLAPDFSRARLGLLPLGTGNDFARTAELPADLHEALLVIRAGHIRHIDVIRAQTATTRFMINVSAGGFSASVNDVMTEELKDTWGPLCYARSFVEALSGLQDFQTEIILDDSERLDVQAYNIVVANGRYVAKGLPIAPTAEIDDGLADLVVLPASGLRALASLAPATLFGRHLESEHILFRRARKIEIRSKPHMRFNTDGELIGSCPITYEVLPGVLQFLSPAPKLLESEV
ncbi:MAG TPA: diacylglycerol kinase family protein [Chthoniobacteraceae bacterium]